MIRNLDLQPMRNLFYHEWLDTNSRILIKKVKFTLNKHYILSGEE